VFFFFSLWVGILQSDLDITLFADDQASLSGSDDEDEYDRAEVDAAMERELRGSAARGDVDSASAEEEVRRLISGLLPSLQAGSGPGATLARSIFRST
jgi:hypothetical protein